MSAIQVITYWEDLMAQENTAVDRQKDIQTGREQRSDGGRKVARPAYSTAVSTSSPFSLMHRMAEDMDRLFDHFGFGAHFGTGLQRPFLDDDFWASQAQQSLWTPQLETFQRGDKLVVRADLPGMTREDVNVEIDNGVLTISGERKHEHQEDHDGFYRSERRYGRFHRSIALPEGVNPEQCEATFKDGVLEIQLAAPKQEARKAKKIQIR